MSEPSWRSKSANDVLVDLASLVARYSSEHYNEHFVERPETLLLSTAAYARVMQRMDLDVHQGGLCIPRPGVRRYACRQDERPLHSPG